MSIGVSRTDVTKLNKPLFSARNNRKLVNEVGLEPNRPVIKNYLKEGSRNENKFVSDSSNQFIGRNKFLASDWLLETVEEKEIRRRQIREVTGMGTEPD
jgi:hypothetical protein